MEKGPVFGEDINTVCVHSHGAEVVRLLKSLAKYFILIILNIVSQVRLASRGHQARSDGKFGSFY